MNCTVASIGKTRMVSQESPYTVVDPKTAMVATVVGSLSEAPDISPGPRDLTTASGVKRLRASSTGFSRLTCGSSSVERHCTEPELFRPRDRDSTPPSLSRSPFPPGPMKAHVSGHHVRCELRV